MQLIAILFMLVGGGALAIFVVVAMMLDRKERERADGPATAAPRRDSIAASLLVQILAAGGTAADEALRRVRREAGIAAPVTRGIDVPNWADNYARIATAEQRQRLLETAVQLVATRSEPVPLRQYAALLDLSFGLGFHTDALARLRETYGFDYVDHAKTARPRSADRGGGAAPLYVRGDRDATELHRILGLSPQPTRQEIIAAYRRLVAQHHPDKFHGAPENVHREASAKFIEITRAYEELLVLHRD